ncbi:hypothetical protein QFC22_000508 [Naganishia vaughanmartiniae]|uniref:Uncharacterized protein n=1 Tax=Naganishia vaughanmartiniae TaxID=1424756 RepID=A0ACC2XRA9_9TREE|nr:hypothetical protein QFC22_000508 [Naganishia vaughanmartiniae]
MSVDPASQGAAKSDMQPRAQQQASQTLPDSDKTTPSLATDGSSHQTSPLGDMTNSHGNHAGSDVIIVDEDIEIIGERMADEVQVVGEKRHDPPVSVEEDGPPPDKMRRSSELRSVGEVETATANYAGSNAPSSFSMGHHSGMILTSHSSLPSGASPLAPLGAADSVPSDRNPNHPHRISEIWKHFTDTHNSYGEERSRCNMCQGMFVPHLDNVSSHYYRCVTHRGGFEKDEARRLICEWIILHDVPVETVCSNEFGALISLIGTRHLQPPDVPTLKVNMRTMYHKALQAVIVHLRQVKSTVHFSFDTWAGHEGEHHYIGVFAHFINDTWQYKEVLIQLIRCSSFSSVELLASRMDKVFASLGITSTRGPGTTQFKSSNKAIASLLVTESEEENPDAMSTEEIVPCSVHVAIEAAKAFTRVNCDLTDDGVDRIFCEQNRDLEDTSRDMQVAKPLAADEMDELLNEEEDDPMFTAPKHTIRLGVMTGTLEEGETTAPYASPLLHLHDLAIYIGESTWRTLQFDTIRIEKGQMSGDSLPAYTTLTSWKSIDALISRALELRESIIAFCEVQQSKHPECPVITDRDLETLRCLKSAFTIFYRLISVLAPTEARVHLILPVFHAAVKDLMQLEAECELEDRPAFTAAIEELMEYVKLFLHNNWVCAAWALNPPVRGDNLKKTFDVFMSDDFSRFELDLNGREEEVIHWIKGRMDKHNAKVFDRMPDMKAAYLAGDLAANPSWLGNPELQWSTYNSPDMSSWQLPNESILGYWRRQSERRDLHVLGLVAKDVLGLATSVSGVDRLGSTFNTLSAKGNVSLTYSVAAEQSCLKAWLQQKIVPPLEKAHSA